jgi:nicotinate-nucleotide adenylyltransferase
MARRVGVFGGTFNPVHLGHLRAVEEAIESLKLDECLILPAAIPPHKADQAVASFAHRWRMLTLAIGDNPRVQASDLETRLPGKSYTVLSLQALHRSSPGGSDFFFLLGLDAFQEIHTWWHYRELFGLASLVVLRRAAACQEDLAKTLHERVSPLYRWNAAGRRFVHPELRPVHYVKITHLDISSSHIRALVAAGKSIRYLVTPETMGYISQHGLYGVRPAANRGVSAPSEAGCRQ